MNMQCQSTKTAPTDGLPSLPDPAFRRVRECDLDCYTSDQMRDYAKQAVTAERERCIEWCRKVMTHHQAHQDCAQEPDDATFRDGEACGAEDCIEAIERYGDWP